MARNPNPFIEENGLPAWPVLKTYTDECGRFIKVYKPAYATDYHDMIRECITANVIIETPVLA
jgi:hypothetical protein